MVKVEEIMNKKVEFIEPDASVFDAIERMVGKKIRSLGVKPKEEKGEYGVISVRDVVLRVLGADLDPKKVEVEKVTTRPIVSVDRDVDINEVMHLMQKHRIARVFVKEGENIIGVCALLDVMAGLLIQKVREHYVT
jgi:CBS domain-containing protein